MTRVDVLIVLVALLLSPLFDAVAHSGVVAHDSSPNAAVSTVSLDGCPSSGSNRDSWHAAVHCVAHLLAYFERVDTLSQIAPYSRVSFPVASNDLTGGRSTHPPVPPPLT